MRVHGEIKIKRQENVEQKPRYKDYSDILSKDFGHICGYCGKSEMVTTKGFEPDHFVPERIDPTRKTDYYNLVNCCFTCNRKKLGKWPTEDKDVCHNGNVGFIDPAKDEFDEHIERDVSGGIVHKTPIGQYMCENVFKFHERPMKEIWKFMKIMQEKELLAFCKDNLSANELKVYIELDLMIADLHKHLFSRRE